MDNILEKNIAALNEKFAEMGQKNSNSFRGAVVCKTNYLLGLYPDRCFVESSNSAHLIAG
jgi:hypothetical protein